jgi:hypothetical protein
MGRIVLDQGLGVGQLGVNWGVVAPKAMVLDRGLLRLLRLHRGTAKHTRNLNTPPPA